MNLHSLTKDYLTAWNKRNKDAFEQLFAEDISLKDWEIEAGGKASVIGANANIWEAVPDIHISIMHIGVCEEQNKTYAEIIVTSTQENLNLRVIDVIKFNNDGKIKSVDAYKQ